MEQNFRWVIFLCCLLSVGGCKQNTVTNQNSDGATGSGAFTSEYSQRHGFGVSTGATGIADTTGVGSTGTTIAGAVDPVLGFTDREFATTLLAHLGANQAIFSANLRDRAQVHSTPPIEEEGRKHGDVRETVGPFRLASLGSRVGDVMVKYNYAPGTNPSATPIQDVTRVGAITIYAHVPGYNPAAGDLFWAKYDYVNGSFTELSASGKAAGCISCHARAGSTYRFVR
jgi:hypothetical protein